LSNTFRAKFPSSWRQELVGIFLTLVYQILAEQSL